MEIYVYGTGCGAGALVDTALPVERVTAFVDRQARSDTFLGRPVIPPEALAGQNPDLLIVTGSQAGQIEQELAGIGVDPEKIFFLKNHLVPVDRNRSYALACELLGEDYVNRIRLSERLIRVPLWTDREAITGPEAESDYVRLKTLEAICQRLDGVPGHAAELGVYRGGFARWINRLLPDRRLYLFDSFEGFDEAERSGCGAGFVEAHRNTGPAFVLSALPHPERAVVRQGFFPKTAEGLEEERFALVSLDVDLEESTLAGLRWFLPRMTAGGCLLLHDYNNPMLPGVRRAFVRYEAEAGRLHAVPLCDVNGTLAISV